MSAIPNENRETVRLRADGHCERCGRSIANYPADIHHRRPRSMGGTRRPEIHAPESLVVLCRDCHVWVESNRAQASEHGWLVLHRDPRDPAEVPVFVAGGWWLVTADRLVPFAQRVMF